MAVILESQKEVDLSSGLKVDVEVVDGKLQLKVIGAIDNVIKNSLVPILTSNTTPAPFVASASSQHSSYAPWRAFDGTVDSDINRWISGIDLPLPQWLKIDLGQQKKLYSYALTMVAGGDQSPQSWVLEGSNDNINWSIVHSITNDPPWNSKERREYIVNSSQYYRYYRIMVTQKYGGRATTIGELELFERYFDHYSHSGHVEYGPIDLGPHFREITSISTIKEIPQGTDIKMYTSTSNDYINFSEWSLVDENGNITSPQGRYIKIKIELIGKTIENTNIAYTFSQEDQLRFYPNEFVVFDGGLKLKTKYEMLMELDNTIQDGKLYTAIIDKSKFKTLKEISNSINKKIDLSGGTGGTSGQKVYTAPNGVVVTSSAPVYVNSNYYYMGYLFDNTIPSSQTESTKYWLTSSSGNQTLTFDFGSIMPIYISQIKVWPRCRDDASSNYRILISDDGINFTEVVPWVTNTHDSLTPYGTVRVHDVNITNRYVRFELTQNGSWGVCLSEIEFYSFLGKFLFEDNGKIKTYDINLGWKNVGDLPVTKDMFITDGISDISILNDEAFKNLESNLVKILYFTEKDIPNVNLSYLALPNPQLILPKENITLTGTLINFNLQADVFSGYSDTLVPQMTSNTTPEGEVKASSIVANNQPYLAFDRNYLPNGWLGSKNNEMWLLYDFKSPKIINKYTLVMSYSTDSAPKDWRFEGSNDGINWDVLDERNNITNWILQQKKEFVFENNTPYSQYRIYILNNNGHPYYINIGEMEMMSKISSPDIRIMISFDSGQNWKSYKFNSWIDVNINNYSDIKSNGMTVHEFNMIPKEQWSSLSNSLQIAYYLEQESLRDIASINSLTYSEELVVLTPSLSNLKIIYNELDKKYSGLMFMDTSQQYYSTSFGEILKYLDFGTMISGQTSLDVKVYLTNTLPFDVKNIRIYPEHNIDGLTVELSKTNLPFIAESELFYDQVLGFDEVIEFYVRLTTDKNKIGGGTFDIKVKADAV